MEVSAKDGTNINTLFAKLGEKVAEYVKNVQKVAPEDAGKRISLHKKEDEVEPGGCKC